jgi:hypothetical protein
MSNSTEHHNPFASSTSPKLRVSLGMLLLSTVVFAAISMAIMMASRVPIIANNVNEFFGLPATAKPDKPDRTTHLIFLLFCYSSPLLLATWVGLVHSAYSYILSRKQANFIDDIADERD